MGRLSTKIYGERPASGASKLEQLRHVRRVAYFATLPWVVLGIAVVVVVDGSGFGDGVAVAVGCMWLLGFATVNLQIRRERLGGGRQDRS